MTEFEIAFAAAVWVIGALACIVGMEPDGAAEGVFTIIVSFTAWPLLALGWLVSRPFTR